MINNQLVYSKELDFIPKLQLSKSRRAVYYYKIDYNKTPKKYLLDNKLQWGRPNNYILYEEPLLKEGYIWFNGYLCKGTYPSSGVPVIKNSRSVGKPRYFIINGQDLYSGKFEREARGNLIYKLHDYFKELVKDCPILVKKETERFRLVLTWYINPDCVTVDYDNLWIYEKCILDVLHKEAIGLCKVKEDSHKYFKGGSKDYEYRETEGFKIEIYKI
jgi:hypothetical protein